MTRIHQARALGASASAVAALAAGCGGGDGGDNNAKPATSPKGSDQILRLTVDPSPGEIKFDKSKLTAKPGKVAIELVNPVELGHNVRIAAGKKCCLRPGSKDIGGTNTIGKGKTRAVVDLKPGNYVYYCSIGGHWQRGQRGSLVVK
jgi:plastocyanin